MLKKYVDSNGVATMKNSTAVKKRKTELPYDPKIPLLGTYPKELKAGTWTNLYTHVHSSIICNCQKVEATQVCTDRWIDKQNAVHTHNGTLFSLKKEGNSDMG